jgi:DNA invertase Pin-like site-specific DNA recombinase
MLRWFSSELTFSDLLRTTIPPRCRSFEGNRLTLLCRRNRIPKVSLSKWSLSMRYGYARVSSKSQDYTGQLRRSRRQGASGFSEKASGKSTDGRRECDKLKRAILPGDTIVVTKLDRLARSSRDLHNILGDLASAGCGFTSLGEAWCDTTTDVGRLMLTIMGGIAEFERGLIRKRCEEGIERAKATRFGRPSALDPGQRLRIAERYSAGDTMAALAREYDCGEATFWRALQ